MFAFASLDLLIDPVNDAVGYRSQPAGPHPLSKLIHSPKIKQEVEARVTDFAMCYI